MALINLAGMGPPGASPPAPPLELFPLFCSNTECDPLLPGNGLDKVAEHGVGLLGIFFVSRRLKLSLKLKTNG